MTEISNKHYIDGQWIKSTGPLFSSKNPSNGNTCWEGFNAGEPEIKQAIYAAKQALGAWSSLSFEIRAQYCQQFAKEVEKNREALSLLISQETGKPLWESQTEVTAVIGKIQLSIQAYLERTGSKTIESAEVKQSLRFKPHGVVVVLGAFNFPAHLSNGHIVPALLAGNTVLYKPSEYAPAVAAFIMQCWHDSGLPAGVINCLQGDANCAKNLLKEDIQGVYFTGSYATGLQINQQFSQRPEVILALEMGGNNPLVIDETQNINAAVYQSILSTMITAGQRCTCARRLMIPRSTTGDTFLEKFIRSCQALKIGTYNENPQPFMGPVISDKAAQMHLHHQQKLIELGGKVLLEMRSLTANTGFLSPGVMDMTQVSNPPDQEIFAPFVQIYRYDDFQEAIALANDTAYGLAAGLFSDNEKHYEKFFQEIRAGLINWNRPTTGAASSLPFGGVGHSGNHRPSAYFAADYCAYPIASMEQTTLSLPTEFLPGIAMEAQS